MTAKISAAESQVMEVLWKAKALSPEDIIARVGPANGWAPGTVKTLVNRLLKKGAIAGAREKSGYVYRPLLTRADYLTDESRGLLDRLFRGELAPLVAHFAERRQLTPKDVAKLKALLADLEERKDD